MPKPSEACISCGEDTAPGTPFYSDRRMVDPEGPDRRFLCSSCARRALAGDRGVPLTDAERHDLEAGAAAFGAFAPGGH
jgi:hypothetical protein